MAEGEKPGSNILWPEARSIARWFADSDRSAESVPGRRRFVRVFTEVETGRQIIRADCASQRVVLRLRRPRNPFIETRIARQSFRWRFVRCASTSRSSRHAAIETLRKRRRPCRRISPMRCSGKWGCTEPPPTPAVVAPRDQPGRRASSRSLKTRARARLPRPGPGRRVPCQDRTARQPPPIC